LISFGSPAKPQWSVFDTGTKAWTPIQIDTTDAAWAPNSYKIAYFEKAMNGSVLTTLDLGSTSPTPKTLVTFPEQDFLVSWKSPNAIFLADRSSAFFAGSIFSVNAKTGVISPVIEDRVGLEATWDPTGAIALVFVGDASGRGGQLGIVDASGNLLHKLSFLTLPSKCAFVAPVTAGTATSSVSTTASAVVCGIPRDQDKLVENPMPDAYEQRSFMTTDDIYEIDLSKGTLTPLFNDQSQNFDITDLQVGSGTVYFINRYDSKLYSLPVTL
jgi:hypothetical protein